MVHFLWCLRLDLRRVGKPIDVLRGGVGLPAVEDVGALPLVVLVVQALGCRGALAAGMKRGVRWCLGWGLILVFMFGMKLKRSLEDEMQLNILNSPLHCRVI